MATKHHTPESNTSTTKATKKENIKPVRSIKVGYKPYDKRVKVCEQQGEYFRTISAARPWINLQGNWLEQAGFSVNSQVKVRVMPGCLILTPDNPTDHAGRLFDQLSEENQALVMKMMAELGSRKTAKR